MSSDIASRPARPALSPPRLPRFRPPRATRNSGLAYPVWISNRRRPTARGTRSRTTPQYGLGTVLGSTGSTPSSSCLRSSARLRSIRARRARGRAKRTSSGSSNSATPRPRRPRMGRARASSRRTRRSGSVWSFGTWTRSRRRAACTVIQCGMREACITCTCRSCGRRACSWGCISTGRARWIRCRPALHLLCQLPPALQVAERQPNWPRTLADQQARA